MIQIALFAVVFVLFLLAIIPRILFYAVSWRLRQGARHEMSMRAESVVLKPLIRAICLSGDEFTCQQCGESHSEADDDSSLSSNTRCLFCRRFHMCGTFVALLSTAVELRVADLWQFEKIIGAEVGLPLEVMAEKPSQSMRCSVTCLSMEFLPLRLWKSKLPVNLILLSQPLERIFPLPSDMIRFRSGAETLIFSVGILRLLSGRIDGTHEASRELMIERMDVCASLAEDKVDASLTVCGVFGGFAQDADESAFFQSLYSGLCSIEKSHSWLAPSHKTSYTSSYIKKMEQKCIHLSVHVEPSRNQEDCAARVAWLAAANVVPALVESIGSTKLDVTLPSAATESFSFVFETNGFHLDAIEPKWGSTGNSDFTWEPWKAKEDSFTPSPISDVLTEAESKCRLVEVAQFSTWRHANVVGFRIYEVEVEMPSVMLANMHRHLARAVAAVGGDACGGERERWSGWFRRRWFSTVATTSMNQLTLDGHFEAFRLAFLASCGARIECKVSRAHCSASALPRCSPSRTPLSSAATTASLMQQQQQSSMPSPLFLEFAVSSSDFHLRSPDTSTSSMPPTILVALPAFQVCCSLSQRSMDVSLCEPVELRIDPGAHLCVVELLLLTRRLFRIRRPAETVDTVTSSSAPMSTPWNVGVRNTATTRLNYSSGCHSASMVFSGMDVYVSSTSSHLSLRVNSSKLALLCDGREIAVLQNFVLRRLPLSGAHRKVAFQLTTPENTCLEIQSESTRFTFPFNYNFYACFDEFLNVRRAIKYAKSANSPFFAEVKAMEDGAEAVAPSKSTPPSGLPCDLVFRVKKFTLEIKDDPFECKLSDDFMVLMDESVEQQKRVAALVSQLERSRRSHGAPQSSAMAAAELQTCIEQLEFQRAAEYIARIRRFYSGYTMADDLFTWRMETACLHILTDDAFISPQKVIKEIQRLDDVSPWNNLQPSDFSQLCCRRVHLAVGRFQWQLRDYSKPLVDATELTLTGSFAVATRRSMDRRSQRDCKVNLIPIWQPSSINVVRYVSPTKFFYELFADVKEMSLCYGSNWEPTIAWLNLRLDDIRRASVDPSTPPLGWWDRVRLSYHGRLGFTCARFSWLYSTSLDPYNAHEFLTCQWTTCTFDWIPGHIFVNGDLDLFFQTASKYDGVCHVLQIPGLNFEVSMDWLSFGNQFDHHSVMPVNGERLTADELAHDSYAAFRGNRLLLGLVFSVNDVSTTQPPRCFIYTNLLKLFDRLKMCLSRISRPIRRGAVFNRIRPRKPFFGQLLQSLGVSVRMPCLEVTYWVSYNRRLGVHACCGALDLHSTFSVHVEGEREARTSVGAVVFILPSCNPQRRIAPQWSLQRVDARILNCRAWLLDRPDRTALHLISGADGSSFDQDSLLTSFPPNSELLIFSSIRFERELRSQMDMPVQPVRVRIPGLEGFNEEAKEDTGPVETEDTKSSVNEDSSSVSPERRHTPKIQLSHEDLEPVHRVMVENPKMRWNETNRNLVYTMMNMYNHAQTLKKNLSAQALKGISLDIANGPTIPSLSSSQSRNEGDRASISSRDNGAEPSKASVCIDAGTLTEEGKVNEHSPTSLCMNAMGPDAWSEVPMLAKLVKEAETAKFYAYCEEEPKQPNVLDQLQGLSLCTSSPVLSRQWHIELSNCQVMLKPNDCAGYVIVSAAKARLDSVEHPPVWRDARLLSKSSLIGQMECMQYYATVSGGGGDLEASTPDQWLSSADVRDWQRLGADFGQDALSGRPEVVGSGHAVGGIVSAAPSTTTSTSVTAIQLQRMVSRCACQFVYVTYAPLVPTSLPPGQFVPPLPPSEDDSKILQSQEGADTFTLLHRTLNLCTNSLQYSMVFDIVNNLLLYVEPQQKERFERNRVGLSLLDERELRQAILRDQETLRGLVNTQRVHERELWAALRLFDRSLHAAHSGSPPSSASTKQILTPASCLSPSTSAAINAASSRMPPALASQAEQILAFEERIGQLKASIVEKNSLLSQSIAHFQKVHVQSQRLQGGQSVVMAGADPTGGRQREILPISGCNTNNTEGKTGLPITLRSSSASTTSPAASGATTAVGASVGISGAVGNSGAESSPEATATEVEAEVVRRDEVCFEHARWRMTEADGQIGLADVELRGFLYARTHGRDDSGSHWLQLGSMRVHSLAPNSFYKEVLLPDCGSSYHHIGGPMIRVACTQRPPVGGISVKEVMEISVAPLVLQVSKPFYNQLMPFFFPERGNEEGSSSTTAEQADTLDPSTPGSADFIASSEDLHDGVESWLKRRNRQGSKIISRLDPKTWSGRLLSHSGRHYSHRHQHQQRKAVAEETVLEEGVLEVNPTVEQSERGGSAGPTSGPELSLLPLDVMRERARRNHVFLYIKIPGFPIRLSYKGDKQKNLADVTNFELNIPMLEYHNRLWTWLDFVLEVKMRIRRQLIKEVIKQKLRPRRALSWHMARPTSSDRVSAVAAEAADTRVEEEMSLEGHFHSNNSSAPLTASNTLAASNRREQEILKLILGRHAAEHPQQPSGRRRFRVFR
ncbi:Breast cancer overexpressed locus tag 1 protein [Echinococcus multilocularis]|uniref:Breast cancer overexpressed locus tag 1 protein n=1 Tax=Echinococcus multilocularis TaxID=6211 RepID=A0A068YFW2_ECHMU|nr:Breast cancer overexpressed locus tag 1 protein [Echinococcus multilocularis]